MRGSPRQYTKFMFENFVRLALSLSALTLFAWACDNGADNGPRDEKISVYLSKDAEEPVTELSVPCRGGEVDLYVKADEDFSIIWQDSNTSPWIKCTGKETDGEWTTVHLKVSAISSTGYYTRRTGTLTLNVPDKYLGTFITVNQGLVARMSQNFSFLKYGSASPLSTAGEMQFQKWTGTSQKWESTIFEEGKLQACYGKYGWLYIGDENGNQADLITPYTNALRADSLLMVSFKAIGYSSETGVKDIAKLTVEVVGGGVIQDFAEEGRTSIDIDLKNFSVDDPENLTTSMWEVSVSSYNVFIISKDKNPVTADTQIRFYVPDGGGKANRVALDNIYIRSYKINEDVQDENVFARNGGSGPDVLVGSDEEVVE